MYNKDLSIVMTIGGLELSSFFARYFGAARPKPNRMIWLAGIRTGKPHYHDWSVMIQIYRPGMELDWHEDGYGISNKVWSWVFLQPKQGGILEIEGPYKKWWRFHAFDGGINSHRVTRCGGYRGVIMFQRSRKLKKEMAHE